MAATIHKHFDSNGVRKVLDLNDNLIDIEAPIAVFSHFFKPVTAPFIWAVENAGTILPVIDENGVMEITTGGAADDNAELASSICFDGDKGLYAVARIKTTDQANSAFNFGFTDAYTEGDSALPYEFSIATLTNNADDCAMWFHDADATTNKFRVATSNGAVDSTIIDSAGAADDSWHIYELLLTVTTGAVEAFFDGASQGTLSTVLDPTKQFCVYFGFLGRAAAADKVQLDYMGAAQLTARA